MDNIFITKLTINALRQLKNIEIPLSETERLPLILTGKNGSGKTSVLEAMKNVLEHPNNISNAKNHLESYKKEIAKAKNEQLNSLNKAEVNLKIQQLKQQETDLRDFIIRNEKFICQKRRFFVGLLPCKTKFAI
jgi:recombinational DNA repair ATPase RecF